METRGDDGVLRLVVALLRELQQRQVSNRGYVAASMVCSALLVMLGEIPNLAPQTLTRVRAQLNQEIAQALVRARGEIPPREMARKIRAILGCRWPSAGTLENWERGIGTPPAVVLYAAHMIAEVNPAIRGDNSLSATAESEPIPLPLTRIPRI